MFGKNPVLPEAGCMELPHLALPQKTGSKRNIKPCSEAPRSYSNSPKCWVEKDVVGLDLIFLYLQSQRGCQWALCWDCSPAVFTGQVDYFNCRTCESFHVAESLYCAGYRKRWLDGAFIGAELTGSRFELLFHLLSFCIRQVRSALSTFVLPETIILVQAQGWVRGDASYQRV